MQPEKVRGYRPADQINELTDTKAMLYALGIGFSTDPLYESDFKFTYELSEGFVPFPTVSSVIGNFSLFEDLDKIEFPKFNKMGLLHGEHSTYCYAPIPVNSKFRLRRVFEDIQDKGKGALLVIKSQLTDMEDSSKIYAENVGRFYIRGLGGFGDKGVTKNPTYPKISADRKPDAIYQQKLRPDQAILYRLCGDWNPLHIEPKMAKQGGFPRPILHGLCFYGISARAVYERFCEGKVQNFRSISARFTSHVYPGETLVVKMYKLEGGRIAIETTTKERGKVVLKAVAEVEINPDAKL